MSGPVPMAVQIAPGNSTAVRHQSWLLLLTAYSVAPEPAMAMTLWASPMSRQGTGAASTGYRRHSRLSDPERKSRSPSAAIAVPPLASSIGSQSHGALLPRRSNTLRVIFSMLGSPSSWIQSVVPELKTVPFRLKIPIVAQPGFPAQERRSAEASTTKESGVDSSPVTLG